MNSSDLKQKTVLITGGTGFAGSHLVDLLLKQKNVDIHVTSFSDHTSYVHDLLDKSQIHKLDLNNKNDVFDLFKKNKPDEIYHLASISVVGRSFDEASKIILNNVSLQLNLLEAIREICPESKVLIVGSALEYDFIKNKSSFLPFGKSLKIKETDALGPISPYAVSKVAQDLLALSYHYSYKLKVLRVRPFNHIGERQAEGFAVSDFAKQIIGCRTKDEGCKINVGNLNAERDFTDVKDMVRAYEIVMKRGKIGEVYNVGSGKAYSMREILDALIKLSENNVEVVVDKDKFRPLDVDQIIADNRKILALGWKPQIPIETTLMRILDYWRSLS